MSKITASIGSLFSNLLSLLTYLYSQPGCQDNVCRTAYSRNYSRILAPIYLAHSCSRICEKLLKNKEYEVTLVDCQALFLAARANFW